MINIINIINNKWNLFCLKTISFSLACKKYIISSAKIFVGAFVLLDQVFGKQTETEIKVAYTQSCNLYRSNPGNQTSPLCEQNVFNLRNKTYFCFLEQDGSLIILDRNFKTIFQYPLFALKETELFLPKISVEVLEGDEDEVHILGTNITGEVYKLVIKPEYFKYAEIVNFQIICFKKGFIGYPITQVGLKDQESFLLDCNNTLHKQPSQPELGPELLPTFEAKGFSFFNQPKFVYDKNLIFFCSNAGKIIIANKKTMETVFTHQLMDPMDFVLNDPIVKDEYIFFYTPKGEVLICQNGTKVLSVVVNTSITGACVTQLPTDSQKGEVVFMNSHLDVFILNFDKNHKFEINQVDNLQKLSENKIVKKQGHQIFGPFLLENNLDQQKKLGFFASNGEVIVITIKNEKIENVFRMASKSFATLYTPLILEGNKPKKSKKFLLFNEDFQKNQLNILKIRF